MIYPVVAVGFLAAFVLTATALLVARRAYARDRGHSGELVVSPCERAVESRCRNLNGGWH